MTSKPPQKGVLSTARLIVGIISIVLFVLVSFQSCAAGLGNALEENNATSGSAGLLLAIIFLIAGITGVATRNSKGRGAPIFCCVAYWLGAAFTLGTGSTYGDLPLWGGVSFVFGVIFLIAAIKTKKQ